MSDSRNFIPMFNQQDVNMNQTMNQAFQVQQRMDHYSNGISPRPLSLSDTNAIRGIGNPIANQSRLTMMDREITRNQIQRQSTMCGPDSYLNRIQRDTEFQFKKFEPIKVDMPKLDISFPKPDFGLDFSTTKRGFNYSFDKLNDKFY